MNDIYNGIMGLIVGDALGVPTEFKKRDTYKITGITGFGTHNQPPGTWSDDSSMTLATIESVGRLKKIDLSDIMRNFYRWLYEGEFTPYGKVFDVGGATRRAIEKYAAGVSIKECGGKKITDNGNGSLMRILPLAFVKGDYKLVGDVAGLTHRHGISTKACVLYVSAADKIVRGVSFEKILAEMCSDSWSTTIGLRDVRGIGREDVKSTGYVVDTLEAVLWCLYNEEIRVLPGVRSAFGLDFGYTNDPTALFCGLVDTKAKTIWVFDEIYKRGMSNEAIAEAMIKAGYAKEKIRADAAESKSIDRLYALGLSCIRRARKGKDSVNSGIDFIQDYKIFVHPKYVNFITEISNYTWDTDSRTGQKINKPIDDFNHLMDAMRYAMEDFSRSNAFSFE